MPYDLNLYLGYLTVDSLVSQYPGPIKTVHELVQSAAVSRACNLGLVRYLCLTNSRDRPGCGATSRLKSIMSQRIDVILVTLPHHALGPGTAVGI